MSYYYYLNIMPTSTYQLFSPQLNEITPFIDGTLFYGPAKAWTDAIRSFKDGRLKAMDESDNIKDSFPAKNDIRLPFANPPPPRDHILKPVHRFLSE